MLFNIYSNDQPIHADTRSFIYADELCIASQGNDFNNTESSLTFALSTMTTYYDTNQLRANPPKTQVCAFHLRIREAKREMDLMQNGTRLSNTTTPVYLGIHLDRTLCHKTQTGLSRRCPVGGLRLRGATYDGPPPLMPPTRRGLSG